MMSKSLKPQRKKVSIHLQLYNVYNLLWNNITSLNKNFARAIISKNLQTPKIICKQTLNMQINIDFQVKVNVPIIFSLYTLPNAALISPEPFLQLSITHLNYWNISVSLTYQYDHLLTSSKILILALYYSFSLYHTRKNAA